MSRSYRHTPILGHGGGSEKQDKRIYNRRLRSRVRQMLHSCADFDAVLLPKVREVSELWDMSKDGKSYCDSLAGFVRTLEKIVRVRDGHRRTQFAITDATVDLAVETHRLWRLRFYSMFGHDVSWLAFDKRRDEASSRIDDLRK
jgi:hypothetical protein